MKLLVFAGGAGTRLWPLSRKSTPKQFEPFFDGKSTLQLAIDRVREFGMENVYVSTTSSYVDIVKKQIPDLDPSHIIVEPERRDVAAAVGLGLTVAKADGASGTVAVLWSDHVMERPEEFTGALKKAEKLLESDSERFIFIGEKPRYANHNLGWIHIGDKVEDGEHKFVGWKYRPDLDVCEDMFASGEWLWNPGYFVFDLDFCLGMYREHEPQMYEALQGMVATSSIETEYGKLDKKHFDTAILEKLDPSQATVLSVDMGWSDPGTLYAMKELLAEHPDANVEKGNVLCHESKDCFLYNEEDGKLLTSVGLEGVVVVNAKDSILVCHKDHVPRIKELLKKIEDEGLDKYL